MCFALGNFDFKVNSEVWFSKIGQKHNIFIAVLRSQISSPKWAFQVVPSTLTIEEEHSSQKYSLQASAWRIFRLTYECLIINFFFGLKKFICLNFSKHLSYCCDVIYLLFGGVCHPQVVGIINT